MDKRFIIILVLVTFATVLLSSAVKNSALKGGARLIDKIELEGSQSLLNLAKNSESEKDYLKTKKTLTKFIEKFPDSKKSVRIQEDIESLNMKILFSDIITEDSLSYKIKRGDTLAKIASRFNTTIELLRKSNRLKSDLILPGKTLKVNKAEFSILVDKSENILTLKKTHDEIVKTYKVSTGENLSTPVGTFKIEEKLVSPVWYKVGAIVEPDSSEYELGSRWMGLSVSGYGIHGTKDPSSIGRHITKGCVRMRNEEVEELYAVLPAGAKVVIVE